MTAPVTVLQRIGEGAARVEIALTSCLVLPVLLLGALSLGLAASAGARPPGALRADQAVLALALGGAGLLWMVGRLRLFTRVERDGDGGLRLRNALGVTLRRGSGAEDKPLRLTLQRAVLVSTIGTVRRHEVAHLCLQIGAGPPARSWPLLLPDAERACAELEARLGTDPPPAAI